MVDNPRFLILPWIKIPNLGSRILALIRRRLPKDWPERYNTMPVLIETFVETPRYTGAVYKASGWIRVGTTQAAGATTGTSCTTSPQRTSGSAPSEKTGSELSIAEINQPATAQRNHYLHRNLGTACTSLAWCCCSVDLAVIDLSTILEIGHNILIYRNYRDALTQQSD